MMRKREHDLQHKIEEEKNAPRSSVSMNNYEFRGAMEDEEILECRG